MAIFEVIGLGSIMPFLSVLGNPDNIETNQYLNYTYNYFNFNNKEDFLILLGVFSIFMLLLSASIRVIASYAKFRFSNIRRHSLGLKLIKKYLKQPYSFFLQRNSSEISKNILSETDQVINNAILPSLNVISNLLLAIFLITFLVFVDPFLAIILGTMFGGFYFLMYFIVRKYLSKIGKNRDESNTLRFKVTSETIGGIKDIKLLGKEKVYLENFTKPSYEFSHYNSLNNTISEVPQFFVEVLAFGALLSMSMYIFINNNQSIDNLLPVLGLYALGAVKIKPAVHNIYKSVANMKFGASSLDILMNDLQKEITSTIPQTISNEKLELKNSLELRNIEYYYPNNSKPALENINLKIKANTTVGFIGTTGAGKSTLVDLILGLFSSSKGSLVVDEMIIDKFNLRKWQNIIGYVPQNIYLIDDSIANNIAFGIEKELVDFDRVIEVSKMAQVHDFVLEQENGYKTVIGERGVRLSGGQRQRIGIARALYNDPKLLVLDEATSALDNKTEEEVMSAINNMSGSKTIIMIAHRLSTIKKCDLIVKLENGKIVDLNEKNEYL
jgi:ABC-type bacteriocin/lantibiotic exporter with double-glycine peptidase domain